MQITILNGNPEKDNTRFESGVRNLSSKLELSGHKVEVFTLREMNITSCTGCWGCWVKKPGECLFPDDTHLIRNSVIHADLVIFASPLIFGFTSALLKLVQDKLIPLLHPYIELVNNESHHQGRYEKYPKLALLYQPEPETDKEDIQIVKHIYERLALNFRSKLLFCYPIEEPATTLIHEINHH